MSESTSTSAMNQGPLEPAVAAAPPAPQWATVSPKARGDVAELFGSIVQDIMTRKVVTVKPGDTLRLAATLLSEKAISGMPVVTEDGKVVGVLSEKDILRVLKEKAGIAVPGGLFDLILEPSEARQKDLLARCHTVLEEVRVATVMSSPAHSVTPGTPSLEAVRQMVAARINRVPVVDHGRLVGIVTRGDVLRLGQVGL
jgi:CBS domain-containing protein